MSSTKLSDIINPQVMGDMIEAKTEALCKLTPYAKVDTTLQGTAGDTKTVPSWNYVGDAEDFDPESGNEIQTTKLTASSTTFTIKCAGKSISIYQTAINSGLGNPMIGGNIQAEFQIFNTDENEIGESVKHWETVQTLKGWLDLSGGDSKYTAYNAKIQESTHIFISDYAALDSRITAEKSRVVINGKTCDIMLIDNPMELCEQLEIYLKFTGGQ